MNYLSDEWVQQQLEAFDQHKQELVGTIGEIRDAAKLVTQLRAAVESTRGDVVNLRREVADTNNSVEQLREHAATHAEAVSAELTAKVLEEVRALVADQSKELEQLRATVATLETEGAAQRERIATLEAPAPVTSRNDRAWLPRSLSALKSAISRTNRGGS